MGTLIAREVNIAVTTAGLDPMGKVIGGFITISRHLQKTHRRVSKRWQDNPFNKSKDCYDLEFLWRRDIPGEETYYFLLAYENDNRDGTNTLSGLWGLIVEPTGAALDEYWRIGVFYHF